jgi:hypothetical protein
MAKETVIIYTSLNLAYKEVCGGKTREEPKPKKNK